MEKNINLDLFWKKVFLYTKYRSLDVSNKKFVDKIFSDVAEVVSSSQTQTLNNIDSNIYDLKKYDLEKLKDEHRFWLIDNPLGIIFTGIYGAHETIRPVLSILHLFIEGKINDEIVKFIMTDGNYGIITVNRFSLSDIYIAMHYGIYESGAEVEIDVSVEKVIASDSYPFDNLNQSIIKQKYKIDNINYSKEDALSDFSNIEFK